mgnify:CR=1 FL=1
MSRNPKRRAHVWYSINNKSELVMQDENEQGEPSSLMTQLCAIGFLLAFVLIFTFSVFTAEGVLCALGVISDC